jgi:LPS export ABC transporter protein LptC
MIRLNVICVIFFGILIVSCENKAEDIEEFINLDNLPAQTTIDAIVTFSDSAKINMRLKAPIMERYTGANAYTEMVDGLELLFYDSLMNVESKLVAKYGIMRDEDNVVEVRQEVVFQNEKGEILETELLFWDQQTNKIYTDKFVTITREDGVIHGNGLVAKENFSEWEILNIRGDIFVDSPKNQNQE